MSKKITAAIVATLSVSVPAMAADIYVPTANPVPLISGVPVYNWSGLRIGLGAGTTMLNNRVSAPLGPITIAGVGGRGFVGTLSAGYDHALANGVVVGASVLGRYGDADASWSGIGFNGEIKADYGFDVTARLGYSITPNTLAYVLGGYSWQHYKLTGTAPAVSQNWGASGYVVGIGTETAFRDNWTWSSEYRYANYGTEGVAAYGGGVDPVVHSFYSSLNYRPGGGPSGQSVAPVVYDWNGLKVGGSLGLAVTDSKFTVGGSVVDGMSNEAFLAEVNIGYDREFGGKWLGGVVLAAGYDGGRSQTLALGTAIIAKTEDFGFDAMLRVGRKFNDQTVGYVIGGYSWQQMTASGGGFSNSTGVSGFTIGTGTEFALSEKLTAFAEYRYSDYQDFQFGPGPSATIDPSDHSVRVGAKWKLY